MQLGDSVTSARMPRWRGRVADIWDHEKLGRVALVFWERRGNQYMPVQLKQTVEPIESLQKNTPR